MATITKRELAERIAAKTGLTQVSIKQTLQLLLDEIIAALAEGNRMEFRDFGIFEIVQRKPRIGRNPRTGQRVGVPAKRVVIFRMGKLMKEKVSGAVASTSTPTQTPTA